jgi:2-dehydro-3-deoxy-D-arabinonate dehydratase
MGSSGEKTMRICRFWRPAGGAGIGLVIDGRVYDLTALDPMNFRSLTDLICSEDPAGAIRQAVGELKGSPSLSYASLDVPPEPGRPHLLAPLTRQEVWGAGVTYLRSRDARMDESADGGSCYDKVYDASRPELFFKSTPSRVAGPSDPIRIRADSRWTVPEPELALVVSRTGTLVGYTIGNDVSSRDIEGENPLYLPQAKIYMHSCALGPALTLADWVPEIRKSCIKLQIRRQGAVCFEGATGLDKMKRNFDELISYLFREQNFRSGVILLTGTGIVPPDEFTLKPGDVVEITVPEIGTLRNTAS